MSVLPVTTVRTSFPLSNQRLLFQLNADQIALQKQYDQLSTGKRVLRLSDDPAAASRAIGLHRGIDHAHKSVATLLPHSTFISQPTAHYPVSTML